MVCGLTLADAATGPGSAAGTPFADPRVARIARVARAGHLGDLIVYDLVGARSPGILLGLDPATRRRLVDYVARFVLPRRRRGATAHGAIGSVTQAGIAAAKGIPAAAAHTCSR